MFTEILHKCKYHYEKKDVFIVAWNFLFSTDDISPAVMNTQLV